jgi:LmbE family N-acetylglucosaminyl deacetylase
MLDADYTCMEEKDCRIFTGEEPLEKAVETIRSFAPDVVFTHYPQDYMIDHEEASRIVRSAVFTAPIPNFHTGADDPASEMDHIPVLYYWDPMEGKDIFGQPVPPRTLVDITGTIDAKKEMLSCHESQREWLLRQHGIDEYINTMLDNARRAGERAGVEYAEGFTQHLGHAYPTDDVLGDTLPELVHPCG